jgi:hypothetical protein
MVVGKERPPKCLARSREASGWCCNGCWLRNISSTAKNRLENALLPRVKDSSRHIWKPCAMDGWIDRSNSGADGLSTDARHHEVADVSCRT